MPHRPRSRGYGRLRELGEGADSKEEALGSKKWSEEQRRTIIRAFYKAHPEERRRERQRRRYQRHYGPETRFAHRFQSRY